jgi:Leucine-rich repeat (LRR) protein
MLTASRALSRQTATVSLGPNPFDPGELPASFKNLTQLISLDAHSCNLVGVFPSYLTKMMQLEELYLGNNMLTRAIPPGIWGLKNLLTFDVHDNNLSGNMVIDGFAAISLTTINLSQNKLTGTIPEVFGRFKNLTYLDLSRNNFYDE